MRGGAAVVLPYRCRSRRHDGECADRWRRELYCRLRDGALQRAPLRDVVFATWTLPTECHRPHSDLPREHWTKADWAAETRRLEKLTKRLSGLVSDHLRELNQRRRRSGLERLRYVWVVEAHRSGVPHAHAVLVCESLAAELREERAALAFDGYQPAAGPYAAGPPPWSWRAAAPVGLGRMDMSCARSSGALASYLSKLAGELSKQQGTLTLGHHQRTYAASRGMLAPRWQSSGKWVGALVTKHGAYVARARPASRARAIQRGLIITVRGGEVEAAHYDPRAGAGRTRPQRDASSGTTCDTRRSTPHTQYPPPGTLLRTPGRDHIRTKCSRAARPYSDFRRSTVLVV